MQLWELYIYIWAVWNGYEREERKGRGSSAFEFLPEWRWPVRPDPPRSISEGRHRPWFGRAFPNLKTAFYVFYLRLNFEAIFWRWQQTKFFMAFDLLNILILSPISKLSLFLYFSLSLSVSYTPATTVLSSNRCLLPRPQPLVESGGLSASPDRNPALILALVPCCPLAGRGGGERRERRRKGREGWRIWYPWWTSSRGRVLPSVITARRARCRRCGTRCLLLLSSEGR